MANAQPQGQFLQEDFFNNIGGLNTTDSPFKIAETQATDGYNFDYTATGGITKRGGHALINAVANSITPSLGCYLYKTYSGSKTLLRATNSKLQVVNTGAGTTANVTDDTASAGSTCFSSLKQVCFTQFDSTLAQTLWMAGGGQGNGVLNGYNGSKYTANGALAPLGALSDTTAPYGIQALPTGTYYYAASLIKSATGAESNVALDHSVAITIGANQVVRLSLTGITPLDTTKYNKIRVYRSALAPTGVSGFTTGDIVATVSSTTSYIDDDGTIPSASASNVPRAGNTTLDNSMLPVGGTFNVVTTWKRRLVTAINSTLYFSDVNKNESWPLANNLQIPSGGPITALATVSFNNSSTLIIDEILVAFKEREMWIITGSSFVQLTDSFGALLQSVDISLKMLDSIGCVAQNLIVLASGFLFWLDYRGAYLWDGGTKPVYISRPIEYDFSRDGDLALSQLVNGVGVFYRRANQIIWFLSSSTYGNQLIALKLDLRLTMLQSGVSSGIVGRVLEGVFSRDLLNYPVYAAYSDIVSAAETLYLMGNDGRFWSGYLAASDNSTYISFNYRTKTLDLGTPNTSKRFIKVIAWCKANTTADLSLKYWIDYNFTGTNYGQQKAKIATSVNLSYWDVSQWDVDVWDTQAKKYVPVVFNLSNATIGTEGKAITLEFDQSIINTPATIVGFSVIYSLVGLRD